MSDSINSTLALDRAARIIALTRHHWQVSTQTEASPPGRKRRYRPSNRPPERTSSYSGAYFFPKMAGMR